MTTTEAVADATSTDAPESTLTQIDRGAVIDLTDARPDPGAAPHPALQFQSSHRTASVVDSLGVAQLMRARQPGTARPATVVVTDQRVVGLADGQVDWSIPLVSITGVTHSASEPCTVLRTGSTSTALLVPTAAADHLRSALDHALRTLPAPTTPLPSEPAPSTHAPADAPALTGPTPAAPVAHATHPTAPARTAIVGPSVVPGPAEGDAPSQRGIRAVAGTADRAFRALLFLAGSNVLAVMGMVGLFLFVLALPALRATGFSFLTTAEWQPDIHHFGIAAVMTGTILIALVALAVAFPLAAGTALFISEIVPPRIKRVAVTVVDLMAAVPSVVYGMWGRVILQGQVIGVSRWLATWFSWVPLFHVDDADPRNPTASATVYTASTFIAGLVVAMMVIPIAASIMREVFSQAPAGEREGAYALGSTRWGMIRSVVLPFGKGGMIGGTMLGLGRALGETVAVYLIISPIDKINFHVLQAGSNSVSSLIALRQGDASGFGRAALMAAGLSLFVITLAINFTASIIVSRARSGAQTD